MKAQTLEFTKWKKENCQHKQGYVVLVARTVPYLTVVITDRRGKSDAQRYICVSLLWVASFKVMLLKNKSDLSLIIYGFNLRRYL